MSRVTDPQYPDFERTNTSLGFDRARLAAAASDETIAVLAGSAWLESKVSEGGTAVERVREQLGQAREALAAGA